MKLSPILRCKIGSEQGESNSERASATKQTSCLKKTSEGEKSFFQIKMKQSNFALQNWQRARRERQRTSERNEANVSHSEVLPPLSGFFPVQEAEVVRSC